MNDNLKESNTASNLLQESVLIGSSSSNNSSSNNNLSGNVLFDKNLFDNLLIENLVRWFAEDIGDGDHSTLSCIPSNAQGASQLIVKDDGVIAGIEVAKLIFAHFDKNLQMEQFIADGTTVKKGDVAFVVRGSVQSLLQTERLMLNIMQRMSGIATTTHNYMQLLAGTKTQILDTRKTTPGMRMLEKEAVRIGGGTNHRFGLFDMVMLKDNHVDFAGGISPAVEKTRQYLQKNNKNLKIEVEVRNFDELNEALALNIDRIMLDNFSVDNTRRAVELVAGRCPLESSGGITHTTIRDYALCGVDYISVGALTHSVTSLDLSFKAM